MKGHEGGGMVAELLKPDICVIGAGSGGLSVAAAAAAFGVPVVLIEKGKMGGECLNTGCVPSKALIAAGRRAENARRGAPFGVTAQSVAVDFKRVRDHVHGVIGAIAPNDSRERFSALGVRVIAGEAQFTDPETVAVEDYTIKARRFVIASGSSPAIPPIGGLAKIPYLTNETVFDLGVCPTHLLVIGAGPIGLELAQAFRRLGADVAVLEAVQPLAKEDPECAAIVLDALLREGVALRSGVNIASIKQAENEITVGIKAANGRDETFEVSHVLVASGRRPNVEGLGLDKAGIRYGPRGIVVDKGLRTSNKRVYAIGDAVGGAQFTHLANYHAGLVIRNALFRLPVAVRDDLVPRVTFTDPELAHVGLTEAQAKERHRIRILRWPFHDNDRAQTERETEGHIKVVTTKRGRILGATIVGANAGELIASWSLAISQGLNIRAFAGFIVPYPTRAEAGKRAAIDFFAPTLTSPIVRRIIAFLRLLG
jgi:pyruvate/2-oxoglutarate dehydrogenase complex dihydrolipoamide dehydrogenase (E3) component